MIDVIRAFTIGIIDGWEQPYQVNTSRNVDHLCAHNCGHHCGHEWQDRGINIGQFARAGFSSQAWLLGYWPFRFNGNGD